MSFFLYTCLMGGIAVERGRPDGFWNTAWVFLAGWYDVPRDVIITYLDGGRR